MKKIEKTKSTKSERTDIITGEEENFLRVAQNEH
jgi:hypothetical protein